MKFHLVRQNFFYVKKHQSQRSQVRRAQDFDGKSQLKSRLTCRQLLVYRTGQELIKTPERASAFG